MKIDGIFVHWCIRSLGGALSTKRVHKSRPLRTRNACATLRIDRAQSCASLRIAIALLAIGSCNRPAAGPEIQVLGESTRTRIEDPIPDRSPWFDGSRISLVAARGETIGLQLRQRRPGPVTLRIDGVEVRGFSVEVFAVTRPSTALYGKRGSRSGRYADALDVSSAPATDPVYFEIEVSRHVAAGTRQGELAIGGRTIPVDLRVTSVALPALPLRAWAYADPREFPGGGRGAISGAERACAAMFRAHGVLLTPDLDLESWPARREMVTGLPWIPVTIPTDPAAANAQVRGWIAATRGTGAVPFAIPVDEPRTIAARTKVIALAGAVRAAGGGPDTFMYAVTDEPRPEYGDLVDLYISWRAAHRTGDRYARWTYNGAPPYAGSFVLDAATPGARTWGWIGWRWNIPVWYIWDALYWHDRHNRRGAPWPGRALEPRVDPVSFDDGEDHGNFDGVLALPAPDGCRPTLRLAAIRRGLQDRQLLELASACAPEATAALAAELVPRALADAIGTGDDPSWPTDEAAWELARRRLLDLASCARPE